MRRLRRTMDDQVEVLRAKEFFNGGAAANVQSGVREPLGRALQPLQVPQRVSLWPEEHTAHVVVHAGNFVALPVKMFHRFRANQAAASSNEYLHVANLPQGG